MITSRIATKMLFRLVNGGRKIQTIFSKKVMGCEMYLVVFTLNFVVMFTTACYLMFKSDSHTKWKLGMFVLSLVNLWMAYISEFEGVLF